MKSYSHDNTVAVPLRGVSRKQWLELRQKGIGGSEVAALLERSNWTSALEIYWDKIGEIPHKEFRNKYTESGNHHEPWIRSNYQYHDWEINDGGDNMFDNKADKRRFRLVRDPRETYYLKDRPYVRVNVDGIITGCDKYPGVGVLECKTRKSMSMHGLSNGVSEADYLQLQHGMLVLGASYGVMGYLIDGSEWSFVPFQASPDIQNKLLQIYSSFWEKVQKAKAIKAKHKIKYYTGPDKTPGIDKKVLDQLIALEPHPTALSLEIIKDKVLETEKPTEIEGSPDMMDICLAYKDNKEKIKIHETQAKTIYAKILRHMDDARIMQFDDGSNAKVSINKHGTVSLRVNMKNEKA